MTSSLFNFEKTSEGLVKLAHTKGLAVLAPTPKGLAVLAPTPKGLAVLAPTISM